MGLLQRFRLLPSGRKEEGGIGSLGGEWPGTRCGRSRPGLRAGLATALLAAACQTAHPGNGPAAELAAPRIPASGPIVDPPALQIASTPALDPEADRDWIEALLERRAPRLQEPGRNALARQLARASERHGLDPLMVLAVIAHESRFDPHARGAKGARGLMQIRPFVARDVARRHGLPWRGEATLFDPAQNVAIGTAYLAEILEQFGDLELALAGYNMGPHRLRRMVERGGAPQGRYLDGVLSHYADLSVLAAALETGSTPCIEQGC